MDFWYGFWLITGIHLLAAVSPGPDFVLVSQQTLTHGRGTGLWCAAGIAAGLGVHIAYSVAGLAAVIASAAWLMTAVKIGGGLYLVWLGIKGLRAKAAGEVTEIRVQDAAPVAAGAVWRRGFLCNLLNPKAPVYLVSVFTVVLSPAMPLSQLAAYGLWMAVLQFGWFALVALLLSVPRVNRSFRRAGHWIDRVLGAAMAVLGVKVMTG
ncbi:Threonine efflux protein [Kingella potus]|uniref:Threonine efflux protein n=1 Tax=Kingella potus TaxID=265175 RepID=A0A377R1Z0_9NEIS|nr:LysE family transporter [Kingella potus]STR02900.1 Threonine efflux protein [Kingella potus]